MDDQKPVVWMSKRSLSLVGKRCELDEPYRIVVAYSLAEDDFDIPLYAHPAPDVSELVEALESIRELAAGVKDKVVFDLADEALAKWEGKR